MATEPHKVEVVKMSETTYNVMKPEKGVPIKAWTKGVPVEEAAQKQLLNVAQLPFVFRWIAAMPDVHWGIGATVGSVIATSMTAVTTMTFGANPAMPRSG